jgi:hypothetical protein
MKRKRKPLPPRRKRMKRQARLELARSWLTTFRGKNLVRGYTNWFGVDLLCAVKELSLWHRHRSRLRRATKGDYRIPQPTGERIHPNPSATI